MICKKYSFKLRHFLWLLMGSVAVFLLWGVWFLHGYCGRVNQQPLDEYACEIVFPDYSWNLCRVATDIICSPDMLGGGRCLGFAKGRYAAHNLDWLVVDQVESLTRVERNNKHQASIGIGSCNPFFGKSQMGSTYRLVNMLIPIMTVDGINESGVFACVNVAPKGEGRADISRWEYGKQTTMGTNPDADETACDILLVRYVLDHATSACRADDPSSAWNLIHQVNWYASDTRFMNDELHWLIADRDSSFVLEFIDNAPVKITDEKCISNFYAGVNGGYQPHGEGYERYNLVMQAYDSIATIDDMKDTLVKGWYSRLYECSAADTLHFRYSDILEYRAVGEVPSAAFVAHCDSIIADEISIPDRDPNCKRWASRHSAIYDLETKTVLVCFDESGDFKEYKL